MGSTTSFAWQHGQTIFRFSPSLRPMAVLYASARKKVGAPTAAGAPGPKSFSEKLRTKYLSLKTALGLRRRIAAREAWRGPHLGPDHLWIRRRRRRRRRRCGRRPRLVRQRLAFHQKFHFVRVEHFAHQQRLRDAVQQFAVAGQDALRLFVTVADDSLHFAVDLQRGVFTEVAVLGDFAAQEDGFFLLAER